MSLAQVLSTYLNLNFLIVIAFAGLWVFACVLKRLRLRLSAVNELKLHYFVLMLVFAFTALHPSLPHSEVFAPAAKVWSAKSIKSFPDQWTAADKGGYLAVPTPRGTATVQADQVARTWIVLALILFAAGALHIGRDLRVLVKIKHDSYQVRKIGRVRLLISDAIHVPFSYWLPGQANIVLPETLIAQREDYRMAIAHELQHHRNGDTCWVYALWGLKLLTIFNPFTHFWSRYISELQEFACDETLVDRRKVESQAYARCLVEVAQTAINQKHVPVCATGLTFLVERNLLKRRIEKMFSQSSIQIGRTISAGVGLVLALAMGGAAYASRGLVQDRRVNMAQAKLMAMRAQAETGFPVAVNDLVLKQLNRYIGTPEGREFMRKSLARMQNYKAVVGDYLKRYGVPPEIMAVPITESGYENLDESRSPSNVRAAGLWQFIPSTARNFGLRVDSQKDERMDVNLQTDAAMRYLQSNNLRFKDWSLALLSYNMGENAVQKAINTLGTRDAWTLIRNGYEGDKDYLARLMAAILIMKNPESVE